MKLIGFLKGNVTNNIKISLEKHLSEIKILTSGISVSVIAINIS